MRRRIERKLAPTEKRMDFLPDNDEWARLNQRERLG